MVRLTDIKARLSNVDVDTCEEILGGEVIDDDEDIYCEVKMDAEVKGGKLVLDKSEKSDELD